MLYEHRSHFTCFDTPLFKTSERISLEPVVMFNVSKNGYVSKQHRLRFSIPLFVFKRLSAFCFNRLRLRLTSIISLFFLSITVTFKWATFAIISLVTGDCFLKAIARIRPVAFFLFHRLTDRAIEAIFCFIMH